MKLSSIHKQPEAWEKSMKQVFADTAQQKAQDCDLSEKGKERQILYRIMPDFFLEELSRL